MNAIGDPGNSGRSLGRPEAGARGLSPDAAAAGGPWAEEGVAEALRRVFGTEDPMEVMVHSSAAGTAFS